MTDEDAVGLILGHGIALSLAAGALERCQPRDAPRDWQVGRAVAALASRPRRTCADRVYNYEPDVVYVMRIGSRTRRARGATVVAHARGPRFDRGVMQAHPVTP